MTEEYDAKRQQIISDMAAGMSVMDDEEVACRVVSMLIACEGNLNKYSDTLKMVLDAHRMSIRTPEIDEAIAFVRDHSKRNLTFCKGSEKDVVRRAQVIIETIDRRGS